MSLLGIKRVVFGVDNLDPSVSFFEDFGLELARREASIARFDLAEGSSIELRRSSDPALPPPFLDGNGPREIVWGVDTPESLAAIRAELSRDRTVTVDAAGGLHTSDDAGIPIGFELFARQLPVSETTPENTPSHIQRWNLHRKWYDRARPKLIFHVVFGVPNVDAAVAFYMQRLAFRLSDINRGVGVFLRCDGRHEHHNLFFLKSPKRIFSHVSFGVETVDELMAGANWMQRKNWAPTMGLGRHRVSSLVYYYLKCPAGGAAEYSADGDYLTDAWRPRLWDPQYGQFHWVGQAERDARTPQAEFAFIEGPVPKLADTVLDAAGAEPPRH